MKERVLARRLGTWWATNWVINTKDKTTSCTKDIISMKELKQNWTSCPTPVTQETTTYPIVKVKSSMMMTKKNNSFKELNVNSAKETMMIHQVNKVEEAQRTKRRTIEMETMEWSNPGSPTLLWAHHLKRTSIKS